MNRREYLAAGAGAAAGLAAWRVCAAPQEAPHLAMGARAGEVTSNSVLLHTRLSLYPTALPAGEVPGVEGEVCWEWGYDPLLADARRTEWSPVSPGDDFTHRQELTDLEPGAILYYRAVTRAAGAEERDGRLQRLRLAPSRRELRSVTAILFGCQKYQAREGDLGHAAYEPAGALDPDFAVWTGDNVYYDNDAPPLGRDAESCRIHWRRQYALHRQRLFCSRAGGYWMKDDHDYRFDDADPYAEPERGPSHELGIRLFREQNPVSAPTYRSFSWGGGLQIWLLEGRDYRGRNSFPDGPGKSIWGAAQRTWLQNGLLASDALFKLVISPTPLIGPDRLTKRDSHANVNGYRYERDRFFSWLRDHRVKNVYFCNGDRHWQYQSLHQPTGFQEFGAGCLNAGILQKVPEPMPEIVSPYARSEAGFLRVRVLCEGPDSTYPEIVFDHYNWKGEPQSSYAAHHVA